MGKAARLKRERRLKKLSLREENEREIQEFYDADLERFETYSRLKKEGKLPDGINSEEELDAHIFDYKHSFEIHKIILEKYLDLESGVAWEKAENDYSKINEYYDYEQEIIYKYLI